jgi:hypothetical protein
MPWKIPNTIADAAAFAFVLVSAKVRILLLQMLCQQFRPAADFESPIQGFHVDMHGVLAERQLSRDLFFAVASEQMSESLFEARRQLADRLGNAFNGVRGIATGGWSRREPQGLGGQRAHFHTDEPTQICQQASTTDGVIRHASVQRAHHSKHGGQIPNAGGRMIRINRGLSCWVILQHSEHPVAGFCTEILRIAEVNEVPHLFRVIAPLLSLPEDM